MGIINYYITEYDFRFILI